MGDRRDMIGGRLESDGAGWRLRFTRPLAHPAEKVWRAITEPEHLAAWFPDGISGAWTVGATLTFGSPQVGTFTGEVLQVDPPRLLEYTWGTDVLRFEIEPDGDRCTLILLDAIDELGKAARDGAGWHVCLDALAARLDGVAWQADGRWEALHADYRAAFGPEASTIGPPG